MTIGDAIKRLQAIQDKHGQVRVYFDCPNCGKAFPLGRGYVAVVIGAEQPEDVAAEIQERVSK